MFHKSLLKKVLKGYAYEYGGDDKEGTKITATVYSDYGNQSATATHIDAYGRPLETYTTDSDGNVQPPSVTVYKSNMFGSPVSQTDPNDNTTTVEYDSLQRPVKLTYASGAEETASYDMSVPSMTITDKRGNVQKTVYTKTGEISGIYRQNGDSWIPLSLYTYDSACRPVSVKTYRDSGNFKTEEYTYDLYSRITQKQIKENTTLRSTESYTYSISGTTTKSTAGADGTAIADQIETVDAYGRLLSSQFKNGSETIASTYTYDCFDNCLTATDPMGTKTTNTYDIFGNLLTSQTPYSGTVSNTYDMAGRRQTATDRNGNTAVYHYDVLDRLILEETPFDEQNTAKKKYFYDSASNLISEKQQKNAPGEAESYRTVNYAYNNRNQITAVSGDTVPVSYTYDSAENRISQQIGTGEETAEYLYTYDALGQVLSETNPLGKACTYTYDYAGNVLTKTDRNGNVTQNTYGIFGISKIQIGTSVTDYSYNGIGQLMQKKLTSSQKLTDEESYTYDPFGRMTACENQDCSITNPEVADNGYLLQYSYDKNSNLLGYTLSENQTQKSVVSYQYDQNNRLTKATLDGKIFLYQYDQNGNLLQKQGGGITTQIAYNKANLPVSYQNGTLQSYAYTYALDGNRLTDSETVSQVQKSYQYTNRGELSAETVNGATTAYTYDSRGNRLTKTGADTATYLYDLANRMTKETHDTWYEDNYYDNAGNLTDVYHFYQNADNPDSYGMQFWWYRYNERNQLTSYHKNGDEWAYTYNVNGLRNSKQASHGDTATFTWNGGNMIREKDSVMENIYTYGVDGVAAQKNRLWDLVYQKNAHGDVVSITNINGDTTDSYTYDAFGNQPSSAADYYKNFRFCGEYTDPETGFVYLRNRYYNPSTGRFITEDPVQDGVNWYSYCGGNPITLIDSTGLIPTLEDAAEMASRSYNTYDLSRNGLDSRKLGDGWRLIDEWKGSEGLVIHIYVRGDGEYSSYTGAKEYAFVNKGSSTLSDWANNIQQPFGWSTDMSESISKAEYFAEGDWGNYEITFIGHSKGGAEAASNAVATNRNAILFNPAATALTEYGLDANTYSANMTVYVVKGEPLNALNSLLGAKAIDKYETLPFYSWNPIKNHSMEAIKSGVKGR